MRTHVLRTVPSCFAALRQIKSIQRYVSQPVLLSLVSSLVLSRLDYGSTVLTGISRQLMDRLQSVLNAAARLIYSRRKYDRATPLLKELHWLRVPERIKFRLAVLVFKCRNKMAPHYLADGLQWAADDGSRTRLLSVSYNKLVMRRSRLSTAGDRAFGVAAPRLWNSLPACVSSAKTLSTFKKHLKTQLFNQSYNL